MKRIFSENEKVISFDPVAGFLTVYEGYIVDSAEKFREDLYKVHYTKMIFDNYNSFSLENTDKTVLINNLYKNYEEITIKFKRFALKSLLESKIAVKN